MASLLIKHFEPQLRRMSKRSAGIIPYRRRNAELEVFLVHPGGPFWAHKDFGAWSIPKGEYLDGEEPLDAAQREFMEQTGFVPQGPFLELGDLKQPTGKVVSAWAFAGDYDPEKFKSNTFMMEWPPRSGRQIEVPEVDQCRWFSIEGARVRLLSGQRAFLESALGSRTLNPVPAYGG